MAENQPPPSANDRPHPQPNLLSELAGEIQAEIYSYLDYSGLCNLRATCRSLRKPWTDPEVPLKKELSRAWAQISQRRISIDQVSGQNGPARLTRATQSQVELCAQLVDVTPLIKKWLVHPYKYHFPCTKCNRITELKRFPFFLWAQSFLADFPDGTLVKQSHQEFFDSLVCGKCFTTRYPGYCTLLGTPSHAEYMINCLECDSIKVIRTNRMSTQMVISTFCDICFKKINHQWFDYKKFLQDTLTRMEEHEQTAAYGPQWRGLPMCPVRAKIVRKLTSSEFHLQHFPHPHKVQEWTGFIKSQLTKDPHLITTTARQDKKHGELEGKFQSPRDRGLRRSTLGTKHLIVGFMFLTFIAVYMSIIQEMLVVSILLRLGVLLIALLL